MKNKYIAVAFIMVIALTLVRCTASTVESTTTVTVTSTAQSTETITPTVVATVATATLVPPYNQSGPLFSHTVKIYQEPPEKGTCVKNDVVLVPLDRVDDRWIAWPGSYAYAEPDAPEDCYFTYTGVAEQIGGLDPEKRYLLTISELGSNYAAYNEYVPLH